MPDDQKAPLLVCGASGELGRMVVMALLERFRVPPDQIIATSRNPARIADLAARGVVVRQADFEDPEGLVTALRGAARMLMISIEPDAPTQPGRRERLQTGVIRAAEQAGVPHVLITSAPNPEPGNPAFWHAPHYQTEQALIQSGLAWTILRVWDWPKFHYLNGWKQALEDGVYHTATGQGGASYISKEDTAAAAAGALLSDVSACRRFDLTGPEVMRAEDVFATLAAITGKKVTVVHGSPAEWEAHYRARGRDEFWIPVLHAHMLAQKRGFFGGLSNGVEELSGRKPMTMRECLAQIIAREG